MRKLVLVKATYDLGKDPETGMTVIAEQTHLVALNVDKLDHFTTNEEMEMAVTKTKLYYEMEMPHAKIISIVPSVTISSENVPKSEEGLTLEFPVFNFHPMSEIPEMNPSEHTVIEDDHIEKQSYDVLIDVDGWRKDFRVGFFHVDANGKYHWSLYVDEKTDVKIDLEHARWTYLPLAARG